MFLNILPSIGQSLKQTIVWSHVSIVFKVKLGCLDLDKSLSPLCSANTLFELVLGQ